MNILCILAGVLGMLSPTAAVSICKPDLGLVVDTTKSLGYNNVPVLKEALKSLVQKFDIAEDKTHVSLETFNKKAIVHNKFNDPNYWSVNALIDLINISIDKLKSPTRLDFALEEANGTMFTEDNGDRSGERNVLVVFTDGRTHESTDSGKLESSIGALKSKGVLLIAVAIGPDSRRVKSQRVLNQTGGENVFHVADYASLIDTMNDVFNLICHSICLPDLGLVVDTTKSLGYNNVPVMKEALTRLLKKFDIAEDKTHVSLETFNKKATVHNKLNDPNYWSVNALIDLINISIDKLKSPTRLDYAVVEANGTMFTVANGDRPGDRNVLVVFTDGRTHESTDSNKLTNSITDLKSKGVVMIAVAIGPDSRRVKSQKVLNQTGGENVLYVADYPSLNDAVNDVFNLICSVDGGFSDWSDWSECKDGMQERTRTCTNPPPRGNGKECQGELKETRPCPQKRSSRIGRISAIEEMNLEETN